MRDREGGSSDSPDPPYGPATAEAKIDRKAKYQNRYYQVPYLTRNTIW